MSYVIEVRGRARLSPSWIAMGEGFLAGVIALL